MEGGKLNNSWLIGFSFLVALVLMVYPLPLDWRWLRPELMCLLVIYWVLRSSSVIGGGHGLCVGSCARCGAGQFAGAACAGFWLSLSISLS